MKQLTEKQQAYRKALVQQIHILKATINMGEEHYRSFLQSFGVDSSIQLDIEQLLEAITLMQCMMPRKPNDAKADMWRKRVIASIGGYLDAINHNSSIEYIKGIALQAAGDYKSFNDIPIPRLQDLYNGFIKKAKAARRIELVASELIDVQTSLN
jgi:hypothetical protein